MIQWLCGRESDEERKSDARIWDILQSKSCLGSISTLVCALISIEIFFFVSLSLSHSRPLYYTQEQSHCQSFYFLFFSIFHSILSLFRLENRQKPYLKLEEKKLCLYTSSFCFVWCWNDMYRTMDDESVQKSETSTHASYNKRIG